MEIKYFIMFGPDGHQLYAGVATADAFPEGATECTKEQQGQPNSFILQDQAIIANPDVALI